VLIHRIDASDNTLLYEVKKTAGGDYLTHSFYSTNGEA
jgi:hypothetical protein